MRVLFRTAVAVFAGWLLATQGAVASADTIQVTTPIDQTVAGDQACSLREATVFAAGGPASGCTLEPAPGPPQIAVPAGCYQLEHGPLTLAATMTIAGAGAGPASCAGGGTVIRELGGDRVLNVNNGTVASVSGVTLTGGVLVTGAGILNSGFLTLDAVLITGNAGRSFGAGSVGAGGGAIWNTAVGNLRVVDSTITGNAAGAGGAGDSTHPAGAAGGNGGAIYNAGGVVTIVGSTITGNSAGDGGDGADFGSGGNGATGAPGGSGGGIDNAGGTLDVEGSTISGNRAGNGGSGGEGDVGGSANEGGDGGGIYSTGELFVRDSTVSGNRGGDGGNGGLGDTGSGGDGGFGGSGAGVRSVGATLITNTTLSGNATGAGGGGGLGSPAGLTRYGGIGGGVYLPSGATGEFTNVTIAGNRAGQGGAMALGNGVSATENNSVIASNTGIDECAGGAFTDGGHNIGFGDTRCPGIHGDPRLGPLHDNGGPTPTMALLAGSPAIDLVPATSGQLCPDTDQRGLARPQGASCDAGAYEVAPPVLAGAGATATGPSSASVAVSVTAELQATTVVVRYGTSLAYGWATAAVSAGAASSPVVVSVPLTGLSAATSYHAQVIATNADGSASSGDLTFTTSAAGGAPSRSPGAPVVSRVRQSARRWVEGTAPARISARRGAPVGTTFSFALNRSATVTFAFTQVIRGRRGRAGCVAPTRRNRRKPGCRLTATRGALTFLGQSGVNQLRFQGRLAGGRRLKPGTYMVVITATVAGEPRSAAAMLTFTIVRRAR
jgi:hypothetical protein